MTRYFLAVLFFFIQSYSPAQTLQIRGFNATDAVVESGVEASFDRNLQADHIGQTMKQLSAVPHNIGSPGDRANAQYILGLYRQWGWDAHIETFQVLFPTPKTRVLEMIGPTVYHPLLRELPLKEDPTSGQEGQLPTYNAYSADGDVTGDLVFVNYGLPDDYKVLKEMGIDVRGKIVIAKYGRSWRGTKPKVAQEHGAIGCILYSDPMDDGYFHGDVYPRGAYKNEFGVQRGSVMDMVIYPGDPLTPGTGATPQAKRLTRQEAGNLLKIPVLPISYHDAAPLLEALDGPVAPDSWHGGLPFAYHIGPGKARVHLKLEFNWNLVPCYDVIAMMKGAQYPDEWILRGNHQDAWVNGTNDPVSGQAAMLEEARSIGLMAAKGWRPARTLVYCSWDGEEPALLGSTEWLETHEQELQQKAVVYINSDDNGRGFLSAEGSHALEPMVDEIARDVIDPETHISVFARRNAHDALEAGSTEAKRQAWERTGLHLGAMGSGSDYSSFIQHAGIPALDFAYGGENGGGEYHSIYDDYYDFTHFKDPGFLYEVALSQTAGRAVLRMADADELPFDFQHVWTTVEGYVTELTTLLNNERDAVNLQNRIIEGGGYAAGMDPTRHLHAPEMQAPVPFLDFSPLDNALQQLKRTTDTLEGVFREKLHHGAIPDSLNEIYYRAEQQLLSDSGLPRRPWYRHTLYAPGFYTGYGVKTMPGIREAIEQHNWKEAQDQIQVDADAINRLSAYLEVGVKTAQ